MVFQFPSFDRWKFPKQESFLAVLTPFLKKLPVDHKFVIEIRNKTWLDARFADVLREHNVALALTDTSFMPRPWELKQKFDLVTADFAYVRWLGDRKGIEKQTTTWDKTVVDRTSDLKNWVEVFKSLVSNTKVLNISRSATITMQATVPQRQNCLWICGARVTDSQEGLLMGPHIKTALFCTPYRSAQGFTRKVIKVFHRLTVR